MSTLHLSSSQQISVIGHQHQHQHQHQQKQQHAFERTMYKISNKRQTAPTTLVVPSLLFSSSNNHVQPVETIPAATVSPTPMSSTSSRVSSCSNTTTNSVTRNNKNSHQQVPPGPDVPAPCYLPTTCFPALSSSSRNNSNRSDDSSINTNPIQLQQRRRRQHQHQQTNNNSSIHSGYNENERRQQQQQQQYTTNHTNLVIQQQIQNEVQAMRQNTRLVVSSSSSSNILRIGAVHTYDMLGVGTFSTVTRVSINNHDHDHDLQQQQQQQQQQHYACKSVRNEFASNGDRKGYINAVAQLAYEAYVLSSLHHPHIIKLRGISANGLDQFVLFGSSLGKGVGVHNNTIENSSSMGNDYNPNRGNNSLFLLTDVLQETLDQRINRWKNDDLVASSNNYYHHQDRRNSAKYDICIHLASALEYVHSKNIVYRDLKPENIGFDSRGALQLFDFGLCRELTPILPKAIGIIGTMRYMAPEVALGYDYDPNCDIYSYAIVCWELWTQSLPYAKLTPDMYHEYVCHRGYRPNNDEELQQQVLLLPPHEVSSLLTKAWSHIPSSRCRWPILQQQLSLFKTLEELRSEEQELLSQYDE